MQLSAFAVADLPGAILHGVPEPFELFDIVLVTVFGECTGRNVH
jgi:hypothetical protein